MSYNEPYSIAQKSLAYFEYLAASVNRHSVHSPFIYELIEEVFRKPLQQKSSAPIEVERKWLLNDDTPVFIDDHGAGISRNSTISEIASHSLKEPEESKILGKLVEFYRPKSVLELGTSLGITTAYLARPNTRVYTIESSPKILDQAKKVWQNLKIENIKAFNGDFDELLDKMWTEITQPAMVFVDGNHTFKATLAYFEYIIDKMDHDSFIVFDDIHWSPGMEDAWERIIQDKRISLSVDIFEMGLVFLRKGVRKQHFIIRY